MRRCKKSWLSWLTLLLLLLPVWALAEAQDSFASPDWLMITEMDLPSLEQEPPLSTPGDLAEDASAARRNLPLLSEVVCAELENMGFDPARMLDGIAAPEVEVDGGVARIADQGYQRVMYGLRDCQLDEETGCWYCAVTAGEWLYSPSVTLHWQEAAAEFIDQQLMMVYRRARNGYYSYNAETRRYTVYFERRPSVVNASYLGYQAAYDQEGKLLQYRVFMPQDEEGRGVSVSYTGDGTLLDLTVTVISQTLASDRQYQWTEADGWRTPDAAGQLLPAEAPTGWENMTVKEVMAYCPPHVSPATPVTDGYGIWYPNNTLCVAGLALRDEFPGLTERWYNIVPVDISRDGVIDIPLIASDQYLMGTATVTVEGDNVEVTYKLVNGNIFNQSECLHWFTSMEEVTTAFLENPTSNAVFGMPVSRARDLNGNRVALLFICNRVTYTIPLNAYGGKPVSFWPNQSIWRSYRDNLRALLAQMGP